MVNFDLSRVPTSLEVKRVGKKPLYFSTRSDYYQTLLDQGIVSSEEDLSGNPELVAKVQSHWQSHRGQIGCAFAQFLSNKPEAYKWHRIVVLASNPKDWRLGQYIDKAVNDPDKSALSIIFSRITTNNELVGLLRHFATLPRCQLKEINHPDDNQGDLIIRLGLRVQITRTVHAYALTFGPFSELFPLTRQAPFTEIIFPTKPKVPPLRHGLTDDPNAAHLADLPVPFLDKTWKKMMRKTSELKLRVLGKKHFGARAEVTVSLPRSLWENKEDK